MFLWMFLTHWAFSFFLLGLFDWESADVSSPYFSPLRRARRLAKDVKAADTWRWEFFLGANRGPMYFMTSFWGEDLIHAEPEKWGDGMGPKILGSGSLEPNERGPLWWKFNWELATGGGSDQEFEQLASMENAKLKQKQQLWIEVGMKPLKTFTFHLLFKNRFLDRTLVPSDFPWLQVCLGGGWTLDRSPFFPRSTLKCSVVEL